MDLMHWLYDGEDAVLPVVVSAVGIFVILGICTRLGRLRSLSQMTGFDFGVNVAVGSIIGAVILAPDPSLFRAAVALVTIFAMQIVYSVVRRRLGLIDNPSSQPPHVLWVNGSFVEDHMKATKYTQSDIYYAMRTAKVNNFSEVWFVVAEPTGSVVVWTESDKRELSPEIFEGVKGWEMVAGPGSGLG